MNIIQLLTQLNNTDKLMLISGIVLMLLSVCETIPILDLTVDAGSRKLAALLGMALCLMFVLMKIYNSKNSR